MTTPAQFYRAALTDPEAALRLCAHFSQDEQERMFTIVTVTTIRSFVCDDQEQLTPRERQAMINRLTERYDDLDPAIFGIVIDSCFSPNMMFESASADQFVWAALLTITELIRLMDLPEGHLDTYVDQLVDNDNDFRASQRA